MNKLWLKFNPVTLCGTTHVHANDIGIVPLYVGIFRLFLIEM